MSISLYAGAPKYIVNNREKSDIGTDTEMRFYKNFLP